MAKTRYIVFANGVNATTIAKLKEIIADAVNKQYDELYFLISSGGGSVNEGLSAASLIKSLSIKTTMHNIGQVDSIANVLFASANSRFANINSSFLFHGIQMNYEKANFTANQLNEQYQIAKRLEEDIAKNFSSYTNLEIGQIRNLMNRPNKIVSVEEAKQLGIIHDIKEANIPQGAEVFSV